MTQLYVKTKRQRLNFSLPDNWKLLTFAEFIDHSPKENIEDIVKNALDNPIGSPALSLKVSPSKTVAIIVEDLTRVSPKKHLLRALLNELEAAKVPDSHITIVMALGTHRALSNEELTGAFGEMIVERYRFINHDCRSSDLVPIGKLSTGTPVKINATVFAADIKIGIGSIFPHPLNGFGGGGKILFPGVADYDSILEHHLKYAFRNGSDLGLIKGNPFHEEIGRLATEAKLDFIINSVLDHNDKLYDIVAGSPVEAQLAGIEKCRAAISRSFEKQSDCTIISTFPYSEGTQIMKPLAPASVVTKNKGCVILIADCTVPLADDYIAGCERFREANGEHLRDAVFALFDTNERILPDSPPEFNMSMAQALLGQEDFKVILVTNDIEPDKIKRIGFIPASDLESAFKLVEEYCPEPEVHVIPSGGVILPVLPE